MVGFVENRGEVAVLGGCIEAAARACNPGAHHAKRAERGDSGDDRHAPRDAEGVEEDRNASMPPEAKLDLFVRDDGSDRKGAESRKEED